MYHTRTNSYTPVHHHQTNPNTKTNPYTRTLHSTNITNSWLKSVNNLLETIDNGVGDVVENQAEKLEDFYDIDEVGGQSSVDDILAKRGLLVQDDEDEEDEGENDGVDTTGTRIDIDDTEHAHGHGHGTQENNDHKEGSMTEEEHVNVNVEGEASDEIGEETIDIDVDDIEENESKESGEQSKEGSAEYVHVVEENVDADDGKILQEEESADSTRSHPQDDAHDSNDGNVAIETSAGDDSGDDSGDILVESINENVDGEDEIPENEAAVKTVEPETPKQPLQTEQNGSLQSQIESLKQGLEVQKKLTKEANLEKTAADKETRKLRRTLVKLNAELDSAERELEAQRTELERAAARIEKDRQRSKEEKERLEASHKEDMKTVAEEHKTSIAAMVDAHSNQMSDMEDRIERAEEARAKEGGDMFAELAEAVERERDTLKKLRVVEEEKSSFASQVSSLKTQIVGMESRIEALHQAAESASEQERDTDDRLDAALSLHARQLSQRQAREGELERTIADLSAALVVARSRETSLLNNAGDKRDEGVNSTIAELKDTLLSAKDEVETLHTQLMMEKQKAETLQQELEDVTNERAQETSESLERQKDDDKRVADLTSMITRLQLKQNNFRQLDGGVGGESGLESDSVSEKLQKQVANLSEDLIHQKANLQHSSTEVQTLRNRLKSVLSRAEIAEKAAQSQSYDIERGSGGLQNNQTRRRYGVQNRKAVTSISSAFKLEAGRGETKENIGKVIDTIDTIAIDTGSRFRSDPIARAFFLLYLIILHLWAFCLVIFHAHVTLEPSSDIGPEQLLKHSYRHIEQANIP